MKELWKLTLFVNHDDMKQEQTAVNDLTRANITDFID